ncbi:MAG: hypothetical protein NDJ90_03175 [Oligoflexia bacterium]|nr:hypothetical protein [Oligoflexia bacterium]
MRTSFLGFAARVMLLSASLFGSAAALADSVDFAVGPVSLTVETTNFRLREAQAYLRCHLEETGGTYSGYPMELLPTLVSELGPGATAGSTRYRIDIEAGQLSAWRIYAKIQGCEYGLQLRSETLSNEVVLAGSLRRSSELGALLTNGDLAGELSAKYQPLVVREQRGVIVKAN